MPLLCVLLDATAAVPSEAVADADASRRFSLTDALTGTNPGSDASSPSKKVSASSSFLPARSVDSSSVKNVSSSSCSTTESFCFLAFFLGPPLTGSFFFRAMRLPAIRPSAALLTTPSTDNFGAYAQNRTRAIRTIAQYKTIHISHARKTQTDRP